MSIGSTVPFYLLKTVRTRGLFSCRAYTLLEDARAVRVEGSLISAYASISVPTPAAFSCKRHELKR